MELDWEQMLENEAEFVIQREGEEKEEVVELVNIEDKNKQLQNDLKDAKKNKQSKQQADDTFNNMPVTNKIPNAALDKAQQKIQQEIADMDIAQDLFGADFRRDDVEKPQLVTDIQVADITLKTLKEYESYGKSMGIVLKNELSSINVTQLVIEFVTRVKDRLGFREIQKVQDKLKEFYNEVQQVEKSKDSKKKTAFKIDTIPDIFSDLDVDDKKSLFLGSRPLKSLDDFISYGRYLGDQFLIVANEENISGFLIVVLSQLREKLKLDDFQKIIDKVKIFYNEMAKDSKNNKDKFSLKDFQEEQKKAQLDQKKLIQQKHFEKQQKIQKDLINTKKVNVDQLYIDNYDSEEITDDEEIKDDKALQFAKQHAKQELKLKKKLLYKETEEAQQ